MSNILEFATRLDDAARLAQEVAQFDTDGKLSLTDAYAIQSASIQRRLERGDRRVGVKMGFTSRAKMIQMGLSDVIWGRLTAAMQVEEGGSIDFSRYVHPRASRIEDDVASTIRRALADDPGDILVFHSDGLSEATDPEGNFFGISRLASLIEANQSMSSGDLADSLLNAVQEFTRGGPITDDRTLVVMKVQ